MSVRLGSMLAGACKFLWVSILKGFNSIRQQCKHQRHRQNVHSCHFLSILVVWQHRCAMFCSKSNFKQWSKILTVEWLDDCGQDENDCGQVALEDRLPCLAARYLWQTIEALPQGGACLVVRLQVLGFCFLAWNSVKAVMPSCFLGRLQTVQETKAAFSFSAELEVACWQIEDLYKIGQGSAVLSVRLTANCIEEELRTAAVALLAAEVRMQQWIRWYDIW